MEKKIINKDKIIESITKMVEDKNTVRSFLKGKTPIGTLTQKGIKIGRPI